MSADELKLLLIMVVLFFLYVFPLRRDFRGALCIFALACTTGLVAQLLLGRALNMYTPNVTLFVSYVSLAMIIAWGAALTSIWAVHTWAAGAFRISPGLGSFAACGIPILIVLEVIGSNILRMKLHNYGQYASLMPFLNAMHAPRWLFGYYIGVGVVFFYILKALGLYGRDWSRGFLRRTHVIAAGRDKGVR
jgi:hypothetical protein